MGELNTDFNTILEKRKRVSKKFVPAEFQLEDLADLAEKQHSANWSEMGCYKTTTVEWLIKQHTKDIPYPRVLVITTRSGKGTYFETIPEVMPQWEVYTINVKKTQLVVSGKPLHFNVDLPDPIYPKPVIAIAHYNCFTNNACIPKPLEDENKLPIVNEDGTFEMNVPKNARLLLMHWDMIIVDEAHRLKNPDTQWTRNIKKFKAQHKHIMTGTGFINNPAEIWSLLNFLWPKNYGSHERFAKHFCAFEFIGGYRRVVGIIPDRVEEFRALVRQAGPRRTMLESFPNIKEPITTRISIDLNPTQRTMYNDIRDELYALDQKGEPIFSPNVLSALNRLRQICVATPEVIGDTYDPILDRRIIQVKLVEPSSKLDQVMEILDGLEWDDERRDQVVVFSSFKDPLELLQKRLEKKNIPYLRLLQGHSDLKRYELWHDIWPKQEHQVFLTTIQLGGESINLTSAHRAIFLDRSWSPKDNTQAIGRVYRPGQTEAAQLIYIEAENTVDSRVFQTNELKMGWFKQIFGDEEEEEEDDQ